MSRRGRDDDAAKGSTLLASKAKTHGGSGDSDSSDTEAASKGRSVHGGGGDGSSSSPSAEKGMTLSKAEAGGGSGGGGGEGGESAMSERAAKVSAALFYAGASLATVFVMKIVLTSYGFPSALVLGLAQFVLTTVTFTALALAGFITVPPPSRELLVRIVPVTLIFLGNVLTGLGGTKEISLPMFTVLRRFSILFTMLLEAHVFGKSVPLSIKASVALMLAGAMVAALSDLSFHAVGYAMIFANDALTAMYGVAIRYALAGAKVPLSKNALLLYNSALGAVLLGAFLCLFMPEEIARAKAFAGWADPTFVGLFGAAAAAGCILNYAIFLCTQRNSALTTTVIGCLKNVITSYFGMVVGGDYVFSVLNFVGVNISIAGSLVYSYVTFVSTGAAVS